LNTLTGGFKDQEEGRRKDGAALITVCCKFVLTTPNSRPPAPKNKASGAFAFILKNVFNNPDYRIIYLKTIMSRFDGKPDKTDEG
jgi:hypothetical protein